MNRIRDLKDMAVCAVLVLILGMLWLGELARALVCLPLSYLLGRGKPWAWWWQSSNRETWWSP